jgi:hypothetical protein
MKQHYGTLAIGNLGPGAKSDLVLTSGSYCLSSMSTVPYVTFLGSSGSQKIFSWNELVTIPDGETAIIQNVSAHPGDIFINGGHDYSSRPARITIPVALETKYIEDIYVIYPRFPVDTRIARRAFFVLPFDVELNQTVEVAILGNIRNHSHETSNMIAFLQGILPPFNGIGNLTFVQLETVITYSQIPLGYAAIGDDSFLPHCLLDSAWPVILGLYPDQFIENRSAYYTLEY